MPPAPKRNNAQHQPLTTVLRNIIREYPAGGGVLRELCQNADDAGATEIQFVLDRKKDHSVHNLLNPGLAEFQGPALLASNNSLFKDSDFDSLSRIGDSGKVKDLSSTGKFGRGFNSVYNWTDTPSIISGNNLLILDPHFTWSREVSPDSPGGPLWDFVEEKLSSEMRNQLSAFDCILKDPHNRFEGTIIRLPLRTAGQAKKSKIAPNKPTSEEEIMEVFSKFANELVESLLFLRNIHTITLRIDDDIYAKVESTTGASHKKAMDIINQGYHEVFVKQEKDLCEVDFLTDISLYRGNASDDYKTQTEEKFQYIISHHLRKAAEDEQLQIWAREQKLFPWIAIATPLKGNANFTGRLFTTLPLPIHTKHPVHIHGMFSITPDRSNIHSGGDWTMSDNSETKLGAKWNTWLFQECLPHVWIRNLKFLDAMNESKEAPFMGWSFWPAGIQGGQMEQLWMGVLSIVFKQVVQSNLKLLPTVCENIGARKDVLFTLHIDEDIRNALREARSPVVLPPEDRTHELSKLETESLGLTCLTPATARISLSELRHYCQHISLEVRQVLLGYVLSDRNYENLGSCHAPLLPTSDGEFHGFDDSNGKIYFPKTLQETKLFRESTRMVDTTKLALGTEKQMQQDIKLLDLHTAISIWKVPDAVSYCKQHIFKTVKSKHEDIISIPNFSRFINKFWEWVSRADNKEQLSSSPHLLNDLWLIPTMGNRYQKISDERSCILDISGSRFIGSFLQSAARSLFERHGALYSLYTGEGFTSTTTSMLHSQHYTENCEEISSLMDWLVANSTSFVNQLNDTEKSKLLEYLSSEAKILQHSDRSAKTTALNMRSMKKVRELSLFRDATHILEPNRIRSWFSLDATRDGHLVEYVGIKDIPVVLSAANTVFIDISGDTEILIRTLDLVACPTLEEILGNFVIPSIVNTTNQVLRAPLVRFALDNFDRLSQESMKILSKTEIVPVDTERAVYKRPADMVDMKLAELFFPDEYRVPVRTFYNHHYSILTRLQMSLEMDEKLALERIEVYSQPNRAPEEVKEKAEKLMELYNPKKSLPIEHLSYRWIPATTPKGESGLFSAAECRDYSFKHLVRYAMPLTEFSTHDTWKNALGWNKPLSKLEILRQLEGAKYAKDNRAIGYLILNGGENLTQCKFEFQQWEWVPNTHGIYYKPSDIFLDDIPYLSPYLGTLWPDIKKHDRCVNFLVQLGVNRVPNFRQLKELQDRLAAKGKLDKVDLEVALFIVKEVGIKFSKENLDDFKAPDNTGCLCLLKDLTAGDPGPGEEGRAILNSGVSLSTIRQLHLPSFKDRRLEALIDREFEKDFSQRENSIAAIADTLKRYRSPSSTFNEYLANAEDCGSATEITWVLDKLGIQSSGEPKVIKEGLQEVQGPALFCFNNGLFAPEDFKAVIDIGVGSKREDPSKIGRFGRGALTMYHWTSVPSFISGDSFVIFDPEKKYLKPRAGMKLKLEDVRKRYPDQLQPFEGICGFDKDTTYFKGTIFRFPFRPTSSKSPLCPDNPHYEKTRDYLINYYTDAMDSLIFLKNITLISFWEKSSTKPVWEVFSEKIPIQQDPRIKHLIIKGQCTVDGFPSTSKEWCVISSKKTEDDIPTGSPMMKIQEDDRLEARYGLAALISDKSKLQGRNYMSLPLRKPGTMEIPVYVDANLVTQSNRQSIPLEESEMEEGSEWNRWIFESGVAPLYVILVKYLMQAYGSDGYYYWPPYPSEKTDTVSKIISTRFWERVVSYQYKLYPPASLLSTHGSTKPAETPRNIDLNNAVFNLLDPTDSKFVLPLLLQLGHSNIVTPPLKIQAGLKACCPESMELLSPKYLLDISRSAHDQGKLLDIWEKEHQNNISFFNTLLSFVTNGDTPESMENCALLPLADNALGTFRQKTTGTNYLVAGTSQEREILEIAPNISVHPELDQSLIDKLLSHNDLNVTKFQFEDIPRLHKTMEERNPEYRKIWLKKVWSYFESCARQYPEKKDTYLNILQCMPVYSGTPIGSPDTTIFISPAMFSDEGSTPAIIQQSGLEDPESAVLQSFKGLILVDTLTFPQDQLPQEFIKTVSGSPGLYRLLCSIQILASQNGLPIEDYITKVLQKDDLEALRGLFDPIRMSILLKAQPKADVHLKHLPIWPSESVQLPSYKPATKAILAPDIDISFIKVAESDRFIKASVAKDYSSQLRALGVQKMSLDELLRNSVSQGQSIDDSKMQVYKSFVKELYKHYQGAFSKFPLAVDGNGKYCLLDSLYDFEKPIFRAAFRDLEKTHFLHPSLRELEIWKSGLRQLPTERHYIDCVQSIERRRKESPAEDPQLIDDARAVFGYLQYDDWEMQSWSNGTWDILNSIPSVPVRTNFGNSPSHRISQMRNVLQCQSSNFSTFSKAVSKEYENITWSQHPIMLNTPGTLVLQHIPSRGTPSTTTVLHHLSFLSDNRDNVAPQEIPAYAADIKATYQFLQDRIKNLSSVSPRAKIWFNVEANDIRSMTTSTFQDAWKCSEELCMNRDHDSAKIQCVRTFLIPFSELLCHCGVERIVPANAVPLPEPTIDHPMLMLCNFQRFRREGKLADITLLVGDKELKAHRVVLAAASEYWETMFTGGFCESNQKIIPLHEVNARAVSAVLDYIYSGEASGDDKLDTSDNLQNLTDQLCISEMWKLDDLKAKLECRLCNDDWIQPETVKGILACAEDSRAHALVQVCKRYIANNRVIVQRESSGN